MYVYPAIIILTLIYLYCMYMYVYPAIIILTLIYLYCMCIYFMYTSGDCSSGCRN